MTNWLLVTSNAKERAYFTNMMRLYGLRQSDASNGGEARRLMTINDFDLIIIDMPLTDETGEELGLRASERAATEVMLIAPNSIASAVSLRVEKNGILVLQKPVDIELFHQTYMLASASQHKIAALMCRAGDLQLRIESIRLVDRAKCALMKSRRMTEAEAHHYIEKCAMDMRVTKKQAAEQIINYYNK